MSRQFKTVVSKCFIFKWGNFAYCLGLPNTFFLASQDFFFEKLASQDQYQLQSWMPPKLSTLNDLTSLWFIYHLLYLAIYCGFSRIFLM
jgi:hypothetical protein